MKTKMSEGTLFIGCGVKGSDFLRVGAFSTPAALFDLKAYPSLYFMKGYTATDATQNRNYFSYYSSGTGRPLGFTAWEQISLDTGIDTLTTDAAARLSVSLTSMTWSLARCGLVDETFKSSLSYKLVMYFHPGKHYSCNKLFRNITKNI